MKATSGFAILAALPAAGAFSTPSLSTVAADGHVGRADAVKPRAAFGASTVPAAARAGAQSSTLSGGTVIAAVALLGGLGLRAASRRQRQRSAVKCNAFSSSSSGFMGAQTATSYYVSGLAPVAESQNEDYSLRQGVASMGMKANVWWRTASGWDGSWGGKIFDSRRRESRRRGEELFRHDVDNFELTLHNLVGAPGARKKKIQRGRGKYGSHGRTCGYGNGGAKKRGRGKVNKGYIGGATPLHLSTPKLDKAQIKSMKSDLHTHIPLEILNMCEDGDEVDYTDLYARGFPLDVQKPHELIKVTGKDEDAFEVRNLTVYAHAFDPPAREKIEKLGGKCIRIHKFAGIPIEAMVEKFEKAKAEQAAKEAAVEA